MIEMPSDDFIRYAVFAEISQCRDAAEAKHGKLNPNPWIDLTILAEEFGEVANALLDGGDAEVISELRDTAQVCVAWLERYKRKEIEQRHIELESQS